MSFLEEIQKDMASLPDDAQQMVIQFIRFLKQQYPTRVSPPNQQFSLENQPFVGMWQDRAEMRDSTAWVRQVRRQQWQR